MNSYIDGVQVAKTDNVFFFEELSLYYVDNQYYLVNHNSNGLPTCKNISEGKESPLWRVKPVTLMNATIFKEAIDFWRENWGKNLGAYATVYTYCKLQGFDLIEEGYLSSTEE